MNYNIKVLSKENLSFPDANNAPKDYPLAIGGDLSTDRLILAYRNGIFPWYSDNSPILWWSPDPRFVLFVNELHISKSLNKKLKKDLFELTIDQSFDEVIENCSKVKRKDSYGTWITEEMILAYKKLHSKGYAHSIEARRDGRLVGGFYGVCIGSLFFGESMFHLEPDASKFAFAKFVKKLIEKTNIDLIDCQVYTDYLASFGARLISRKDYLTLLKERIDKDNKINNWNDLL
ncbi:MAG: leucyl/phenylalanyl-tRNA--protein transferase [Spirochaetota bacterium]